MCEAWRRLPHGTPVGIEEICTTTGVKLTSLEDKTFEIHSPHLTASKWWIGSLGRTVRLNILRGYQIVAMLILVG